MARSAFLLLILLLHFFICYHTIIRHICAALTAKYAHSIIGLRICRDRKPATAKLYERLKLTLHEAATDT